MEIIDFSYYDENNNLIEVEKIEIDYWYNTNKYQQALLIYRENKDTVEFANKILPEMILSPSNLKEIKIFDNDFEALSDLLTILIEVQTKKLKAQPKKKKPTLKMQ